jgi:hypothetical protein
VNRSIGRRQLSPGSIALFIYAMIVLFRSEGVFKYVSILKIPMRYSKPKYLLHDYEGYSNFRRLRRKVEKLEGRELAKIMKTKVATLQPILSYHLERLTRKKKYSNQWVDLTRITVLIWQHYDPLLPAEAVVEKVLFNEMTARHKAWLASLKGASFEIGVEMVTKRIFEHQAVFPMDWLYDFLITEPNTIGELSFTDQFELLYSFMVVLDCFEHIKAGQKLPVED